MPRVVGHSRHSNNHHHHHNNNNGNAECFLMCFSTCLQCCVAACVTACDEMSREETFVQASSAPRHDIMTDQEESREKNKRQQELETEIQALLESSHREIKENLTISPRIRQAGKKVLEEGRALIGESNDVALLSSLLESLHCAVDVIHHPNDQDKIQRLNQNAEQAKGKSNVMKKLIGALVSLVGAAIIGLAIAGVPFTGFASLGFGIGGAALCGCGYALFHNGKQKSMSKALHELEQSTLKI